MTGTDSGTGTTQGRVVVVNFVSIDGVVQSPLSPEEDRDGGFDRGGWVPPRSDATVEEVMASATVGAAALLLGRRSYEILRDAWSDADPSAPPVAAMNRVPKHVVSTTLEEADLTWAPATVVAGDLPAAVDRLRDETDGDLLVLGSGTLVAALAAHDLVDEYRLLQFPVVLGGGKRMFGDDGTTAAFRLADTVVTGSGVVVVRWVRDRSADD